MLSKLFVCVSECVCIQKGKIAKTNRTKHKNCVINIFWSLLCAARSSSEKAMMALSQSLFLTYLLATPIILLSTPVVCWLCFMFQFYFDFVRDRKDLLSLSKSSESITEKDLIQKLFSKPQNCARIWFLKQQK